jgi:hypothetical protein
VFVRAGETLEGLRVVLSAHEVVASIIAHGKLDFSRCKPTSPIRLAIEAKLVNFEWMDVITKKTNMEVVVCVRVVVEERSPKHLVVSVYPDRRNEISPDLVPEVPHANW